MKVLVFCSASSGLPEEMLASGRETGVELARAGYEIVYGGGSTGLMGAVADGALAEGSKVYGFIPEFMMAPEIAHQNLTELHVVETMHERKWKMLEMSDIVVALPGGWGTLDELAEALTWRQLGLHQKPIYLLNYKGFWQKLIDHQNQLKDLDMLHGAGDLMKVCDSVEDLIGQVKDVSSR